MAEPMVIELNELLSSESIERLQAEAQRQHLPLPELVREAIEDYLDDLEENYEDTPDEKILSDFAQAWDDAMKGRTRPAREVLAEIRQSMKPHDDQS